MTVKIPEFTREDFLESTKPYDFVKENSANLFEEEQLIQRVDRIAKTAEVISFRNLYTLYKLYKNDYSVGNPNNTVEMIKERGEIMDKQKRTNSEKNAIRSENKCILKYETSQEQIKQAVAKVNEYRKSALNIRNVNTF